MKESSSVTKPPILLVDDEADVRRIVGRELEKAGYSVTQASDGTAALELLKLDPAQKYLLISDIRMPHMNGDVMIIEAKRQGIEFLAIIISTGEAYVGINTARLLAEGAKLLLKPYGPEKLLILVEKLTRTNFI